MLPEVWNSPYLASEFPKHAERIPEVGDAIASEDSSFAGVAAAARECGVVVVAGSIPEVDSGGKVYNTSVVLGRDGKILAKHRKMHLFDIDIPGKQTFKESETLTAGSSITVLPPGVDGLPSDACIGLAICYDVRFPELHLLMRAKGMNMLCLPAAFNTTTGPRHWHLCNRARAADTQSYVLACSPARGETGYQAYGHSLIVSPWAEVLAEAGEGEEIIYATLDFDDLAAARGGIPIGSQRRHDVYTLEARSRA